MLFLAIISLLFFQTVKCDVDISPNVVNGVDTSILDHPYMASVQINWFDEGFIPFCGGAIISRRSVLTGFQLRTFLCLFCN